MKRQLKTQALSVTVVSSLALLPASCSAQHNSAQTISAQNNSAQEKLSPFAALSVGSQGKKGDFPLATTKTASPLYVDANDFPVVRLAADALAGDVQAVTGSKPSVLSSAPAAGTSAVFVGTLGKSRLIDDLVAKKKLDVTGLRGGWEKFLIATVEKPVPGVAQGLVIVGSDRRGTAFGVFSLSESIGVSPWVWWADVKPMHRDSLVIARANYRSQTPSVKYRGIFINDEDWGLHPWATKTFEPETGDIGPKTYARVCELLLRLKANYLWPAMHACTKAFNIYPQNKVVADQYAIVMGSSHAEPMLRNNVTEWNEKTMGAFNYITNRDKILNYWDTRVKENGGYENFYTIGMRGIHDSPMEGSGTTEEKVARMEDIFAQQRSMLAHHVNPDPSQVPQIFVPYKEVLPLYQAGLKVPDDVTLMWVDDNFGYIRQLSNAAEQRRKGRAGVYYHFSYLGTPQSYLWLGSTSPALTAFEMEKAYSYGADRAWVFNVGDIKPIEKEMEFGLRLAYDVNRYPVNKAMSYLDDWATENFGPASASEIAAILNEYYRLTREAKSEHIDRVSFTAEEQAQRLADYRALSQRAQALDARLPAEQKDAFFQLVLYPVRCSDLMNQKQTATVQGNVIKATHTYDEIQRLTTFYNAAMSGGKWNGIMSAHPNNMDVFRAPDATKMARTAAPLLQLAPKAAQLTGKMTVVGDVLVGMEPGQLLVDNGNTAKFTFDAPQTVSTGAGRMLIGTQTQKVSLYFLARCEDDKHDSWFVTLNDQKVVSNDHVTGGKFQWLKITDAELRPGQNQLVVMQRESGAEIRQIAFMPSGTTPAQAESTPNFALDAASYSAAKNTPASRWAKVEGLGAEKSAMTLLPYQTPPIPDADAAKAPALTYTFQGTSAGCTVETRLLPTHPVDGGANLRYAISVDGGPFQIRNINALEFSGMWSTNVLNGYAADSTTHTLRNGANHTVTVALLDPGMALSQVRVFTTATP